MAEREQSRLDIQQSILHAALRNDGGTLTINEEATAYELLGMGAASVMDLAKARDRARYLSERCWLDPAQKGGTNYLFERIDGIEIPQELNVQVADRVRQAMQLVWGQELVASRYAQEARGLQLSHADDCFERLGLPPVRRQVGDRITLTDRQIEEAIADAQDLIQALRNPQDPAFAGPHYTAAQERLSEAITTISDPVSREVHLHRMWDLYERDETPTHTAESRQYELRNGFQEQVNGLREVCRVLDDVQSMENLPFGLPAALGCTLADRDNHAVICNRAAVIDQAVRDLNDEDVRQALMQPGPNGEPPIDWRTLSRRLAAVQAALGPIASNSEAWRTYCDQETQEIHKAIGTVCAYLPGMDGAGPGSAARAFYAARLLGFPKEENPSPEASAARGAELGRNFAYFSRLNVAGVTAAEFDDMQHGIAEATAILADTSQTRNLDQELGQRAGTRIEMFRDRLMRRPSGLFGNPRLYQWLLIGNPVAAGLATVWGAKYLYYQYGVPAFKQIVQPLVEKLTGPLPTAAEPLLVGAAVIGGFMIAKKLGIVGMVRDTLGNIVTGTYRHLRTLYARDISTLVATGESGRLLELWESAELMKAHRDRLIELTGIDRDPKYRKLIEDVHKVDQMYQADIYALAGESLGMSPDKRASLERERKSKSDALVNDAIRMWEDDRYYVMAGKMLLLPKDRAARLPNLYLSRRVSDLIQFAVRVQQEAARHIGSPPGEVNLARNNLMSEIRGQETYGEKSPVPEDVLWFNLPLPCRIWLQASKLTLKLMKYRPAAADPSGLRGL